MKYLNDNIYYLQMKDFDNKGKMISNIPSDKLVMIMIQSNFCGHCTVAKPEYKKFADENMGNVICCTIQADGNEEGEKELSKILDKIDDKFQGFPHYVVYRGGVKVATYEGNRNSKSMNEFIRKLK